MTLSELQQARRRVQKRMQPRRAILGRGDSAGTLYAGDGMLWARYLAAADSNNIAQPGVPFRVRAGDTNYLPRVGRVVWVGPDYDGTLKIIGADHDDLRAAGIDAAVLNPNDPYRQFIRFKDLQNFRALPVGSAAEGSLKVQLRSLLHWRNDYQFAQFAGTSSATHADLTAYVPGADEQRYVVIWYRTIRDSDQSAIQITASTPKSSIDAALTWADIQECAVAADADSVPVQCFRLANEQSELKLSSVTDEDLRQFINMPPVFGFPKTITRLTRVVTDHSATVLGPLVLNSELRVSGEMVIL
jgi:hypothetical protein